MIKMIILVDNDHDMFLMKALLASSLACTYGEVCGSACKGRACGIS